MSTTPQTEAGRLADGLLAETSKFGKPSIQRGLVNGAIQELRRLDAENKAMQSKLDADLALITKQADLLLDQKQTIYSFHYAMKDAGWHPGRTDDDLTDIIRQKGKALAEVEAERDQLRAQLALAVAKEREECARWGGQVVNLMRLAEAADKAVASMTVPAQDFDLTDEEIEAIAQKHMSTVGDHWCNEEAIRERHAEDFARAIIAALRAKEGK